MYISSLGSGQFCSVTEIMVIFGIVLCNIFCKHNEHSASQTNCVHVRSESIGFDDDYQWDTRKPAQVNLRK